MRDSFVFAYLRACGISYSRAARYYPTFAAELGLRKIRYHWKQSLILPYAPKLPSTLAAMRRLSDKPDLINKREYDHAVHAVTYWQRIAAGVTKQRYPTSYRMERRKATRGLHHALAHRDALALTLNEIEPGTIVPPKHRNNNQAPGEAARKATLRYTLRNKERSEAELALEDDAARQAYHDATRAHEQAVAERYIAQAEMERELLRRRTRENPNARSPKGTGKVVRALKAEVHQTKQQVTITQKAYVLTRAKLARCRKAIVTIKAKLTYDEK